MLITGVAGLLCAYWANECRKRQVEAACVKVIESLGGEIINEEIVFRHTVSDSQRMKGRLRPTLIVDAIRIHRNDFDSAARGNLKTWNLREFVDALKGLPDLRYLCIAGSAFGDDDLEKLPALDKLICLSLDETRVTDSGLAYLPTKFKNLVELSLEWTAVDNDLSPLTRLTSLTCLELMGTDVGDEGVRSLVSQTRGIQRLGLGSTRVSDDAMESICMLNQLSELDVSESQVTGSSLYMLKRLPSLRSVGISGMACRHVRELADISIDTLSVTGGTLCEGDIQAIAELSHLSFLELCRVSVAADHIRHLAAAPRLRDVMISDIENADSVEGALRKIGLIAMKPMKL